MLAVPPPHLQRPLLESERAIAAVRLLNRAVLGALRPLFPKRPGVDLDLTVRVRGGDITCESRILAGDQTVK
jgi:hypothetical protein